MLRLQGAFVVVDLVSVREKQEYCPIPSLDSDSKDLREATQQPKEDL